MRFLVNNTNSIYFNLKLYDKENSFHRKIRTVYNDFESITSKLINQQTILLILLIPYCKITYDLLSNVRSITSNVTLITYYFLTLSMKNMKISHLLHSYIT